MTAEAHDRGYVEDGPGAAPDGAMPLTVDLELRLGGTRHRIPTGNIRRLALDMTAYGVQGEVEFVVKHDRRSGLVDRVLEDFPSAEQGEVRVRVEAAHWDSTTDRTLPAIATRGLIVDRWLTEHRNDRQLREPRILWRRYGFSFADPAAVLWSQHFPVDLFTGRTLQAVIDAHRGRDVKLSYDWSVLKTPRPLICLPLSIERGVSFRDFVCWLVDRYDGVLTYDHRRGRYTLSGERAGGGRAATLHRDDVATLRTLFPSVVRRTTRIVNADATRSGRTRVANPNAVGGVYGDVLLRTAVQRDVDDRNAVEKARTLQAGRGVEVRFARYPTVAVTPGSLVDISHRGGFARDRLPAPMPWRVDRLALDATALEQGPDAHYDTEAAGFAVTLDAQLEARSETVTRLPAYRAPIWPVEVEGRIVSATGARDELTYQIARDKKTSLDTYVIELPLFGDQQVRAPFEPYHGSGMFYIPAYKHSKVLLALGFDEAHIARLLDWRPGARVPMDGQGQHLLLGKSATSNTSLLHDYQGDRPVFQIKRTHQKDAAVLRISEGRMVLQVTESK